MQGSEGLMFRLTLLRSFFQSYSSTRLLLEGVDTHFAQATVTIKACNDDTAQFRRLV